MGAGSPIQKEDPNLDHSEYDPDNQDWKYATEPNSRAGSVERESSLEREQREREQEERNDEKYGKNKEELIPKVALGGGTESEPENGKEKANDGDEGKGGKGSEGKEEASSS